MEQAPAEPLGSLRRGNEVLMRSASIRVLAFCLALQAACASAPQREQAKEPSASRELLATVRPQRGNVDLWIPHYPTYVFRILAVEERERKHLIGLVGSIAEDHDAMQVVAVRRRRPLEVRL